MCLSLAFNESIIQVDEYSFYLIPRYLLQETIEPVNSNTHRTTAEVTLWASEEIQCSFTEILNSHLHPNPESEDEIWALTAPCCWRKPYTELFKHTYTHSVQSQADTADVASTQHVVWCVEKKKCWELFSWRGLKGRPIFLSHTHTWNV